MCDRRLLERLGPDDVKRKSSLTTLNGERRERNGIEVELQVTDMDGEETITIPRVWSMEEVYQRKRICRNGITLMFWSFHASIEDRNVMLL